MVRKTNKSKVAKLHNANRSLMVSITPFLSDEMKEAEYVKIEQISRGKKSVSLKLTISS